MMDENKKVMLTDTTLRDGEQSPGVVFSFDDKRDIFRMLVKSGIEEIEIGSPFISDIDRSHIILLNKEKRNLKTACWSRALKQDIDMARDTFSNGINISCPVSDIQLAAINKDRNWALKSIKNSISYARDYFEYVCAGAQDASRADINYLLEYCFIARESGAYRVRIADTVGKLDPFSTYGLIHKIKQSIPDLELEFHAHNDLGMATANTLAAAKAGARYLSVTVGGLGERAGNAALEQVAMALEYSDNFYAGLDATIFIPMAQRVARAANRPIAESNPITGSLALLHESGIHTRSILKNRDTYQIIPASKLGLNENNFVFGRHCGSAALNDFLQTNGIHLSKNNVAVLLNKIKQKAVLQKGAVSPQEIKMLCQDLLPDSCLNPM